MRADRKGRGRGQGDRGRPGQDAPLRPHAEAHRFPQLCARRAQARRAARGAGRRQRLGQDQSARSGLAARPGPWLARTPLCRALPQGRRRRLRRRGQGRVARGRGRDRHRHRPPARARRAAGRTVRIAGKDAERGRARRACQAGLADPGHGRPVHRARRPSGGASSTGSCLPSIPRCAAAQGRYDRAMRQRNRLFQMREGIRALCSRGWRSRWRKPGTAIAAARLDAIARLAGLIERMRAARGEGPFPWAEIALEGRLEAGAVAAAGDRGRGRISRAARAGPRARPGGRARP